MGVQLASPWHAHSMQGGFIFMSQSPTGPHTYSKRKCFMDFTSLANRSTGIEMDWPQDVLSCQIFTGQNPVGDCQLTRNDVRATHFIATSLPDTKCCSMREPHLVTAIRLTCVDLKFTSSIIVWRVHFVSLVGN